MSELHARAFGYRGEVVQPWASRLERHSLTWVGAFMGDRLIGFVHACWDGGAHAFLLDTIVDPDHQTLGIGQRLVESLHRGGQGRGVSQGHHNGNAQISYRLTGIGGGRTHAHGSVGGSRHTRPMTDWIDPGQLAT